MRKLPFLGVMGLAALPSHKVELSAAKAESANSRVGSDLDGYLLRHGTNLKVRNAWRGRNGLSPALDRSAADREKRKSAVVRGQPLIEKGVTSTP